MTNSIAIRRRAKDDVVAFIKPGQTLDRWWEEFGSPDLRRVFEYVGMEVFRRSSCLDGFNGFLKQTKFSGKRCIEFGTCKGLTAVVLSRYFEEVVTIDIEPDKDKRGIADGLGIHNIRFVDVSDNAEKAAVLKDLTFDAAYCDANHAYDAYTDFDLVKSSGRVMFHEYWPLQPTVWELVNSLRSSGKVQTHSNFALWTKT